MVGRKALERIEDVVEEAAGHVAVSDPADGRSRRSHGRMWGDAMPLV